MPDPVTKIKVLFIKASPPRTAALDHDTELRKLQELAQESGWFEVIPVIAATVDDVRKSLLQHEPQILHFAGHGDEHGALVFNKPGKVATFQLLRPQHLADILAAHQAEATSKLQLVVLAGCNTAASADKAADVIGCAIGMNNTVFDTAVAEWFTPTLYAALAAGRSIQNAVDMAKATLHSQKQPIVAEAIDDYYADWLEDSAKVILTAPAPPRLTLTPLHREYLRRLFGTPWATVHLADMLKDRNDEVSLVNVYVPLAVDLSIVVKVEDHKIVDWWVKQDSKEGMREGGREAALLAAMEGEAGEATGRSTEAAAKSHEWTALRVGKEKLDEIVYGVAGCQRGGCKGIQGKILEDQAAGTKTENGEKSWYMEAHDAASVQSRFVLLGGPGSGKSSFLRHLALCLAGETLRRAGDPKVLKNASLDALRDWLLGTYIPIYVELRDVVNKAFPRLPECPQDEARNPSLEDFWRYVRHEVLGEGLAAFEPELHSACRNGTALLMLDGLDEIDSATDERRQRQVKALVAALADVYPDLRLIVTSRPHAYDGGWELPSFGRARLTPLDLRRLNELARAFFEQALPEGFDAAEEAQRFIKVLEERKIEKGLRANPMFFTMLAALWLGRPERDLPETEAELYRESVQLLLDRWTRRRDSDPSVVDKLGVTPDELRWVLEHLACTVHEQSQPKQDTTIFHGKELLGIFLEGGYDAVKVNLPGYLEQRAGLLVSPKSHHFHFLHRSFQEHLAACHLTCRAEDIAKHAPEIPDDRRFPDGLLKRVRARSDLWENVSKLAVAELRTQKREREAWTLMADLVEPYLDEVRESGPVAMLMLEVAERHKLFSVRPGRRDPGAACFPTVREAAEQALTDHETFTPEQRFIAGKLLGSGPFPGHDTRKGAGLRPDGLPDIGWVPVPEIDPQTGQRDFIYGDGERRTEPTFWIARYPVTYAQFEAFVKASDGFCNPAWWEGLSADDDHRRAPGDRAFEFWNHPRERAFEFWNHPRERVSWYDAVAFCRWLTAQARAHRDLLPEALRRQDDWRISLPTEWQWEKAARGHDGREYPWGSEYESGRANIDETVGERGTHYLQSTSAVGMYPHGASPFGIQDMSGNVWEWCLNSYDDPAYCEPAGDAMRVVRGGSWFNLAVNAAARVRAGRNPIYRYGYLGFRVVVGVPVR